MIHRSLTCAASVLRAAGVAALCAWVGCAVGGSKSAVGSDSGVVRFDASVSVDATMERDASQPPRDSGVGVDSGPSRVDSGPSRVDAGFDAGFDAGPPSGGDIDLTPGFSGTFSGDTTRGPTWNRPVAGASCPASSLSSAGTAVAYETRLLRNAGSTTLTVNVATSASYDGYLIIYDGTMIPSDPLMCLAGDDDDGPGSDPDVTFTLRPGQVVLVVATGFGNTHVGAYTMRITAS